MDGPDFRLDGRVALITGSGRGIGLAIGRAFAAVGCSVVLQDIDRDVAAAEAERINSDGGRAMALGGDVADPDLPRQLVEQTTKQFGGLQILVNNAAIQGRTHWLECPANEFLHQWKANLLTPVLLCQLAVPHMRAAVYGRILNLGSVQQRRGSPRMLPYSMSKSALGNMTRTIARDLGKDGITVNMLSPGYFNTHRNRNDFSGPEEMAEKGKWVPLGHIGEPQEAAGAALLLCSPAGAYITGQTLFVDGGLSLR